MQKYETFWRRVAAILVDSFILYLVNWIVIAIAEVFITDRITLVWIILGLIPAFYYILAHYKGGQTIGKMVMKVEVLDDSETPITLGQSILRSLPQLILPMFAISFSTAGESAKESTLILGGIIYALTFLFYVISAVVCLASSKRRALHDFIAGTIVVRTDV